MLDTLEIYRHSGRLGIAPIVVPFVGIVAGFALAFVYAYADVYIPIAGYVSFLLTAGFTMGVGMSISAVAGMAKCRSVGFLRVAGFFIGLLALYFAWVAFLYVLLNKGSASDVEVGLANLLFSPKSVWRIACLIGEEGWYAMRGSDVKGVVLWVFWGIEALIVVVGVAFIAPTGIADQVFCERCDRWCKSAKDFMRLMVPQNAELMTRFTSGQIDAMAELPVAHCTVSPYLRVDLDRCESCQDTATWRASLITHEQTKEGKIEENDQEIVAARLLTPDRLGQLEQYASREPIEPSENGDVGAEAAGAETDEPHTEDRDAASDTEQVAPDADPMTKEYGTVHDDDEMDDSEIYEEKDR